MNPLDFEGSVLFGPKSFTEVTNRHGVWNEKAPEIAEGDREDRPCPYCGQWSNNIVLISKDGWRYDRCKTCGLIYQPEVPSVEKLREVYTSFPAQEMWVSVQGNPIELEIDRRKFRWMLEQVGWPQGVGDATDTKSVLDIGMSTGTMLEVAERMCAPAPCVIAGVEVNDQARKVAENRLLNLQVCPICLPAIDRKFDLIVLSEVLEHVRDPMRMLWEAACLLSPKGAMIVTVPNADSLAVRVLHEKAPVWGLGHLQIPGVETLRQMMVTVLPDDELKFFSFVSFARELSNHFNLNPIFAEDHPQPMWYDPKTVLDRLQGYKLLCVARKK